jgi:ABC-2 type transport system ATP-binding protein
VPVIRAENLSKSFRVAEKEAGLAGTLRHFARRRYRLIEAVKSVSFALEPGEVVGFLGPNGAGKTTALKMLTGLVHPTAGRVEVAGHVPVRRQPAFLKRITLVMGQKQQLIWDLPVLDSLRINAAIYEVPQAEAKRRTDELAGMLGLDRQLTQSVRKLSLGERMKAELLAALLHRPEVLFLDEPTLGLDVNAQVSVRDFLREYNRRFGATVLLTSHYMADIEALASRVLVIHHGRLQFDGLLRELAERTSDRKLVTVRFDPSLGPERTRELAATCGDVLDADGTECVVEVPREHVRSRMAALLELDGVLDFTVEDEPIERVMERVFSTSPEQREAAPA